MHNKNYIYIPTIWVYFVCFRFNSIHRYLNKYYVQQFKRRANNVFLNNVTLKTDSINFWFNGLFVNYFLSWWHYKNTVNLLINKLTNLLEIFFRTNFRTRKSDFNNYIAITIIWTSVMWFDTRNHQNIFFVVTKIIL